MFSGFDEPSRDGRPQVQDRFFEGFARNHNSSFNTKIGHAHGWNRTGNETKVDRILPYKLDPDFQSKL